MTKKRNENGCIGVQTHLWRQVGSWSAADEHIRPPTHWQCVWCGELRPFDSFEPGPTLKYIDELGPPLSKGQWEFLLQRSRDKTKGE